MANIFVILMFLAMGAVVASLLIGVFFMAQEGEDKRRKSNKMMQMRVTLQGLAILFFALAVLSQGH